MINLKKNDAIADAVRGIMEKELVGNQKKLDKNHNGKLDSQDFKMLRGQKKATEEVEELDELSKSTLGSYVKKASLNRSQLSYGSGLAASRGVTDTKGIEKDSQRAKGISKAVGRLSNEDVESVEENAFDYKSPRQPEPNGGSGVKKGARYGGSKQKEKPEQEEPKEKMTLKKMKENYEEPILDELINEVLSKDASAYDYIHDFVHSDNPKFAGKSKAERKKMALGAYYGKKNEEAVQEGLKSVAKKAFKALTGGSDEDQRKDLQRKMGVPQTGKKPEPKNEEVETVEEGRNDTPTPYGSLLNRPISPTVAQTGPRKGMITKKHATRLKDRIKANLNKEEVVSESKGPTSQMDEPFITDAENKPLNNAKSVASKSLKRMKNEMLGKAGTSE